MKIHQATRVMVLALGLAIASSAAAMGDITSGGDGLSPARALEMIKSDFDKYLYFSCKVVGQRVVVDFTTSLDSWTNEGYARVRRPGPTGGAEVVYFEKYTRATHIDPRTGEIEIRIGSAQTDSAGVVQNHLYMNVEMTVAPESAAEKFQFTKLTFVYWSAGPEINAESRLGEIACSWQPFNLKWD